MILSSYSLSIRDTQKKKRQSLFLKGPLTFDWIITNIPDPTSRLILVAQAYMDMNSANEIPLSQKVWSSASIEGKDSRYRVTAHLREHVQGFEVIARPGKTSLLRKRT